MLVFLRHRQETFGLSDLDLLEVFNTAGAELLRNVLADRAVGTAAAVAPRVKDGDTGVIPAIPVDRMGYAKIPNRNK